MPIAVVNLAPAFLAFWEQAKDKSPPEQLSLWETHYARPYRNILDFYSAHHGVDASLELALSRYPALIERLQRVSAGAEPRLVQAAQACAEVLGVAEAPSRHILMVGGFSSNAWADIFEGAPTCFHALELIPDLDFLALIAAHETAHVLHHQLSDVPFDGATVGETLMLEGLATLTSARAVPGMRDEDYLWHGYRATPGGQAVGVWLGACRTQLLNLKRQLLADLDKNDETTLGRYFRTASRYQHEETPVRAGYAVGLWIMRHLSRNGLSQPARWNRERIAREVADALVSL